MNPLEILDRVPNPWNARFLALIVTATVVATIVASTRTDGDNLVFGGIALAICLIAIWGWQRFGKSAQASLVASRPARLVAAPLLVGVPPMLTAVLMGNPGAGGYPASLSVLFGFVILATRDLEQRARADSGDDDEHPVHLLYRSFLALISTVFFFFGVLTLWPWLGKLYGMGYFWVLVLGVLSPTIYLWNKLRQPRHHSSMTALVRFNRVVPYVGLILAIAILIG
jgi:hypothetical protein